MTVADKGGVATSKPVNALAFDAAVLEFVKMLRVQAHEAGIGAIAHRIVYGAGFSGHTRITDDVITKLQGALPFDPDHLPQELAMIAALTSEYPLVPQVACFDTVFHTSMPRVAKILPVPRRYMDAGLMRYGFHGLSYAHLTRQLRSIAGESVARGKVIMAHLGSGVSLTAMNDGQSVETSMGFSPAGGMPMGTRSGDIDPGVVRFITEHDDIDAKALSDILNTQSGLLGISGSHAHMYPLLQTEDSDPHAKDAVDLFCHSARKTIGAYAAVLDGLETLVFSGGMGEDSEPIRRKICTGLSYLGIEIDPERNVRHETRISTDASRVGVYVLHTNEELEMTKIAHALLA